jgi:hypothetical protein
MILFIQECGRFKIETDFVEISHDDMNWLRTVSNGGLFWTG